jgi:hypothetical protein
MPETHCTTATQDQIQPGYLSQVGFDCKNHIRLAALCKTRRKQVGSRDLAVDTSPYGRSSICWQVCVSESKHASHLFYLKKPIVVVLTKHRISWQDVIMSPGEGFELKVQNPHEGGFEPEILWSEPGMETEKNVQLPFFRPT